MKNIIQSGIVMLMAVVAMMACSPQEKDDYSLGTPDGVTDSQVSFTYAPSTVSDNIINFTNTSDAKVPYSQLWDFGNGTTSKSKNAVAQYPLAGDYTVTLTLYAANGAAAVKSQVIHIADNDFGLISTPAYLNLTGGTENADGKTWVIDQYNNFTKEVATALGKDIRGHMGLGSHGSYTQEWWGAGPDEKSAWTLYDFKFNFKQTGVQLNISNNGQGYGRNASSASVGGFTVTHVEGDDATFTYPGGSYTFSIDESGAYPLLTLSGNAFMGYYCGSQDYEIIYQTDKVMALRVDNTVENQDWIFIYCLEELNTSTPAVVKEPKAVPLFEGFESATPTIVFETQDMGAKTGISDNPLFVGNTSNKVYRYEKTTSPSSNVFFVAADYKFDLTKQNKIKMKVLIPSYNDYTTDNGKEDWAPSAKLMPRLVVKLYDSSHGSPWESSTELPYDLPDNKFDQWVDAVFDFNAAADRTDYDKIVIQFGQEGHYGTGIFYFDDFEFVE